MKIHILTPFYRIHLAQTLIHYYEPMGIEWYPIVAPKEDIPFDRDWIHPIHVTELAPKETCARKFNDFLDTQEVIDNDYYGFMCDDNMYEPEFFDVIRKQTAKILIVSAYRGDTLPPDYTVARHGTNILKITSLKNIRIGQIDYCQYIIKGKIFKQNRFDTFNKVNDGVYAVNLRLTYPNDIVFLPDSYVFFNYLQPGRYTTTSTFVKSTWSLPNIIT
jgi:hypothetical protein